MRAWKKLRRRMENGMKSPQTLRGSFSAVSTATIATKYSFFRVFRDLQDSHTFAPPRSQNFSEKPSNFLPEWKWNSIFHSRFSMNFAIFRRKFDEILPEFHRNGQEMTKCLEILKKMREKFGKLQKFPEFVRNFIRSFHFFNHLLSLRKAALRAVLARGKRHGRR